MREDEDALAAMLAPGKIEIRYHKKFSGERIAAIISSLLAQPELAFMRGWEVLYQGRKLSVS